MDETRNRGAAWFGDKFGADQEEALREGFDTSEFGLETGKFAADFAFGTIWSREGLEAKQRSLVVLGILIAHRQVEELKLHVQVALANGLSVRELEEVLYQSVPYAGFPAANTAKKAMIEALTELGLLPTREPASLGG